MEQAQQEKVYMERLPLVAMQIRSALGNIYYGMQKLAPADERDEDPILDANAAMLYHGYFRLLRLAKNLESASMLNRKELLPTIVMTFNGFGENGYENSASDLPTIAQHQMGVKLVESLNKARDNVLMRMMRSRRLIDLASIPLIEEGIKAMTDWVNEFEKLHHVEIGEAIERGVNVRTLDDLRA
jgi:hypothetical protein